MQPPWNWLIIDFLDTPFNVLCSACMDWTKLHQSVTIGWMVHSSNYSEYGHGMLV